MYATLYLNAKDVLYVLDKIKKEGVNSLTFYERWVKKHYDRFLIEQPEDLRRIIDKEKAKQQRRANLPEAARQESDSESDSYSDSDSGSDSDPGDHAGPVANVQQPTSRARHLPPIQQNASRFVRDTMSSQSITREVNAERRGPVHSTPLPAAVAAVINSFGSNQNLQFDTDLSSITEPK